MKSRAIPQLRIFLRMTGLIVAWSVALCLLINHGANLHYLLNFAKIGALFGALLGSIALVVALLYGEVRNRQRFKLTLAVCTSVLPAGLAAFVLHLASAFGVSVKEFIYVLAIVSIFPCVIWFSQLVARQYLREIAPRKRKQKPG